MFLDFLDIRGGGPLVNVFLRALSTNFAFKFSPFKTEFVLGLGTFSSMDELSSEDELHFLIGRFTLRV